jgi:hypothetical protein
VHQLSAGADRKKGTFVVHCFAVVFALQLDWCLQDLRKVQLDCSTAEGKVGHALQLVCMLVVLVLVLVVVVVVVVQPLSIQQLALLYPVCAVGT